MKTGLVRLLCAGLLLVPSVGSAQDNFIGRWGTLDSTSLEEIQGPFWASADITQTVDVISWQTDRGQTLTIRLNQPSVVNGVTYTARWVRKTLLLESQRKRRDGSTAAFVQVLFRNSNDELEVISITPGAGEEQTIVGRLVYGRRK